MDLPVATDLLAQPTRASLFETLRSLRRAATTEELAADLGLHVNGVRRQLQRMHEGGLLVRGRSTGGRGRPHDQWSIAATASPTGARPEAYRDLARWLVRAIEAGPSGLRRAEQVGHEIGHDLVPENSAAFPESFRQIFTALGFQPVFENAGPGEVRCTLGNCPYRDSARENPEVVCTMHKGVTVGILERLQPGARLARFEPHDPDRCGCEIDIVGAESQAPDVAPS